MVGKSQKSGLGLSKYNVAQVHEDHRNDEVKVSAGGDLPPGIEGGIAKIVFCGFGVYKEGTTNAGETFFRAAAVVIEPPLYRGMQTKVGPEPLCDTPNAQGKKKDFADHYNWMLNELRKMGAKEALAAMQDPDAELPGICQSIVDGEVYITFRTWIGEPTTAFPNPRTTEDWRGVIQYIPDESDDGVKDNTAAKKTVATKAAPAASPAPVKKGAATKTAPVKAAPPKRTLDDMSNEEVAEKAQEGDESAQIHLKKRAMDAGVKESSIDDAESWVDVPGMIDNVGTDDAVDYDALGAAADEEQGTGTEGESCAKLRELAGENFNPDAFPTWVEVAASIKELKTTEEVPGDITPGVGETYLYHWYDAKTKAPAKKPTEVEVIKVDAKSQTVTLKNLTTKQLMEKVKFSDLKIG